MSALYVALYISLYISLKILWLIHVYCLFGHSSDIILTMWLQLCRIIFMLL